MVADEYLDLYILGAAALAFTILGFLGVVSINGLASAILALLAVLAYSQVRSRRHVAEIANTSRVDPLAIFRRQFPDDLERRRASAASALVIGHSISRTVQGAPRAALRQLLMSGGKVRVLLLDPTDEALVRVASEHGPHGLTADRLKRRIEATLDELSSIRDTTAGDMEIRVAAFIPKMLIDAIDTAGPDGLIVLQHHEHRPAGESLPIFSLKPGDGFWYQHFASEAERLWEDGTPWPLSPAEALRRCARPVFQEEFGPDLDRSMGTAGDLLITGVTRNALFMNSYGKFEDRLKKGCQIRVLLVDPSSDGIIVAAARYYAERSPDSTRERVRHTLRLLTELKRSTQGDLSVRLSPHPLAMDIISIDARPETRSDISALFIEYNTYQTRRKPKFVLQPGDGRWFDELQEEAEALWSDARDYDLAES